MDSIQLKEKLGHAVHYARSILDKADNGKLSTEDQAAYDRAMADYDGLKADYERALKLEEAENLIGGDNARDFPSGNPAHRVDKPKVDERSPAQKEQDEHNAKIYEENYGRFQHRFAPGSEEHRLASPEYRAKFSRWALGMEEGEHRAITTGSANAINGSGLKTPVQLQSRIIRNLDQLNVVRANATVVTINNGEDLAWPKETSGPNNFAYRADEITTAAGTDSALAYGTVTLRPIRMDGVIEVSNTLLRIGGGVNVEALIADRGAVKIADVEETAFMTGTGTNEPLGLFTASASGIPSSQDKTAASATVYTADELMDVFYMVKGRHRRNGSWVKSTASIKFARKLKDSNGAYLWQPGLRAGEPDTLLGRPILEADAAPGTFTTGLYVSLFGDLSEYVIRDSLSMELLRLDDSAYSRYNKTGFLFRRENNAKPVLGTAFARLKLG